MNHTTGFRRRSGGLLLVGFFLLLVTGITLGALLFLGHTQSVRVLSALEEGRAALQADKHDEAWKSFAKADQGFTFPLRAWQTMQDWRGQSHISRAEVAELIISVSLVAAYNDFFALRPSPDWVQRAEEKLAAVVPADAEEMKRTVATAREVSNLCARLSERKFEEVMKSLLAAEKNALPSDQDFFIMEIRLLIACGRAMGEPEILNHARELLWFISSEAGVKSNRINQLWGLLSR